LVAPKRPLHRGDRRIASRPVGCSRVSSRRVILTGSRKSPPRARQKFSLRGISWTGTLITRSHAQPGLRRAGFVTVRCGVRQQRPVGPASEGGSFSQPMRRNTFRQRLRGSSCRSVTRERRRRWRKPIPPPERRQIPRRFQRFSGRFSAVCQGVFRTAAFLTVQQRD